jgi:hypothetical protein
MRAVSLICLLPPFVSFLYPISISLAGMISADRIASIADACVAAVERKLQSAAAAGGGTSKERALIVDIEAM